MIMIMIKIVPAAGCARVANLNYDANNSGKKV